MRKLLIFLAPIIINWIWENKIMKKKKNPKSIDRRNVIDGRVMR